jgi:uncharacterized protein (DUF1330 family)
VISCGWQMSVTDPIRTRIVRLLDFLFSRLLRDSPQRRGAMSAYVILEGDVRFETSCDGTDAKEASRAYGGEILASGRWDLLVGEQAFTSGMIIRFPNKEAANAWYYAQGYRVLLDVDTVALDCCLRLIS